MGHFVTVEALALGILIATSYRATPAQTKPSCTDRHHCETSVGENVSELGVAVSRDLLASGRVNYGDVLFIQGVGYRIVFDCMAERHRNSIDVFVYEPEEEQKFGVRHLRVWRVR